MARATTARSAPVAGLRRELVSCYMCSWPGMPCSLRGFERRSADVVALSVAMYD